ncbi:hypothetical protein BJ878DRAFT_223989 [Calycina marina]|uniref:Uncharacterized protein n=1 Tax=Calycina marina TaxID=1763456 RepID=A0A9P8CDQ3_9HELO|nr:hypothetical protein BJ878DRAFT_223989 [Calycina marina]
MHPSTPSGGANSRSVCLTTATRSANGGITINGGCPNFPDNVKCCKTSGCDDCSSFCTWTGSGNECGPLGGVLITAICPRPSNYQFCNYGACMGVKVAAMWKCGSVFGLRWE